MTDTQSTTGLCKVLPVDRRGRVRVSAERRQELLAQFDKGDMTAAQFAAFAGINYQTLCGWLQRRRAAGRQPIPAEPKTLEWVEAVVETGERRAVGSGSGVLVVQLRGGARMEIGDPLSAALAAEVLRNLGAAEGGRESRAC